MRDRSREGRRIAAAFAETYRCPDCLSEYQLIDDGSGVLVLEVLHDTTCPQLAAMQREDER